MRKWRVILPAIVLLVSLVIVMTRLPVFADQPDLPPGPYTSAEISIVDVESRQSVLEMTCSDKEVVQALVKTLNTARASPDHKCMAIGSLKLTSEAGTSSVITFLPGHDPECYEIRFGTKKFDLPRAKFLSSVETLGVPLHMIPLSEH